MQALAADRWPACLWWTAAASLVGAFQFGYAAALLNTCLPAVSKDLRFRHDDLLSSAVVVGAALGALAAGGLADRLGPRNAQAVTCLAFVCGALTTAAATGHRAFLFGRAVSGIGAGAASLLVPRTLCEVSPPGLRGWLGSLNQVLINAGILAALAAGLPLEAGVTRIALGGGAVAWWRAMAAAAVLPAVLQVFLLASCPESPVWLEGAGMRDAADEACMRLWGAAALLAEPDYDYDAARAASLVSAAAQRAPDPPGERALRGAPRGAGGLAAPLLRSSSGPSGAGSSGGGAREPPPGGRPRGWGGLGARRYRRIVALCLALPLLQQASGINVVVYYSSKVFAGAGLASPIAGSIVVGGVNLSVTLGAARLLDRAGRRPLLLASYGAMALALGGVAALGAARLPPAAAARGVVGLLLLYVAAFAVGAGPVTWVLLGEILPPEIKGAAGSLATAGAWAGNLAVTLSFGGLVARLGLGGTFGLYAAANAGAAALLAWLLVETRCRTLAEIEQLLLLPDRPPCLRDPLRQRGGGGSSGGDGAGALRGSAQGVPDHARLGAVGLCAPRQPPPRPRGLSSPASQAVTARLPGGGTRSSNARPCPQRAAPCARRRAAAAAAASDASSSSGADLPGPRNAFVPGQESESRRELFNRISPVYDELNDRLSLGQHRVWKRMAVRWARPKPGGRALDVCCGSGDLAQLLAAAVGPSGAVTGLDFAPEMLQDAARREAAAAADAPWRRAAAVEWVQGDALELPFSGAAFDAATMGYGLRNVSDIPRALAELARVLAPGGRAAVLDFNRSTSPLVDGLQACAQAAGASSRRRGGAARRRGARSRPRRRSAAPPPRRQGLLLEGLVVPAAEAYGLGDEYRYLRPSIQRFPTGAEQEALARAAGFRHAVHYEIGFGLMGCLVATNGRAGASAARPPRGVGGAPGTHAKAAGGVGGARGAMCAAGQHGAQDARGEPKPARLEAPSRAAAGASLLARLRRQVTGAARQSNDQLLPPVTHSGGEDESAAAAGDAGSPARAQRSALAAARLQRLSQRVPSPTTSTSSGSSVEPLRKRPAEGGGAAELVQRHKLAKAAYDTLTRPQRQRDDDEHRSQQPQRPGDLAPAPSLPALSVVVRALLQLAAEHGSPAVAAQLRDQLLAQVKAATAAARGAGQPASVAAALHGALPALRAAVRGVCGEAQLELAAAALAGEDAAAVVILPEAAPRPGRGGDAGPAACPARGIAGGAASALETALLQAECEVQLGGLALAEARGGGGLKLGEADMEALLAAEMASAMAAEL
ncbi:menG [Scenedesmus sp. PABB004]|nr:menG [Scenedesmus sp. PABB004]